jgi:hypothetical protein
MDNKDLPKYLGINFAKPDVRLKLIYDGELSESQLMKVLEDKLRRFGYEVFAIIDKAERDLREIGNG